MAKARYLTDEQGNKIYPYAHADATFVGKDNKRLGDVVQEMSQQSIVDNLINYPYCQTSRTASGMTFTVNEDGTIHAKGKPTEATNQGIRTRTTGDKNPMILPPGTYTIHGCPKGGNLKTYYFQVGCTRNDTFFSLGNDYGEGTTFTLTEETQIQILIIIAAECPEIDLVFKPMCEVGTVIHEYQPYVLSRHYLVDNTCVHNLIPYPYYNTSSNIGGIDWVDNGDGTIAASGTENHSTNTNSTFWLASVYNPIFLEAGTYTFTGCPEGASAETWFVRFGDENNNFLASDIGEGCYFTLQTDQYVTASLRVADNVTIPDKIVFKPMLVKGSIPREYKQYKDVEDQIVAENLIESNIHATGFVRCATKAYNDGTCILTADGTSGNPYHCRDYILEQGKTYTFSTKGNSADAKGWYMGVMYVFDTSPVTYETLKTGQIYTNNYKTQSMTFTVNKECRAVRIVVGIPNSAATAGTKVTFTEMMLEEGAVAHKYQPVKANKGYNRVDITNHTLDLNTLNLELGSPDIMQYKCRTSGGSANMTNIPVASSPFNLDVEVVRWASKTDYVTRQVFVAVNKPNFEYVRWCTSGTWSEWVERKFTDTTYSVATTSANGLMSSTDKAKSDMTNIAYATCDTAAATSAKVATIDGNANWKLQKGSIVVVKFTVSNTASNVTLNVNNTGAKSIWFNNAVYTGNSNIVGGYAGRIATFMYDGTYWVWMGYGSDANTTYTNQALGQGYGTCVTGSTTAAKVVTLSGYTLVLGGIVSIKFSYAITGESTMNINSKGAKPIYYRGAAITDGIINAGDTATFIYNGSQYHLISVDRCVDITSCQVGANASTITNQWYKYASMTVNKASNDFDIVFIVRRTYGKNNTDDIGILHAHIRSNANVQFDSASLEWLTKSATINNSDFVLAYKNLDNGGVAFELWTKCTIGYALWQFDILSEGSRVSTLRYWTLHNIINDGTTDSYSAIPTDYTQIQSVALPSGNTSYAWSTGRNINGMWTNGTADRFNYGTCSTAADTVEKTVACDGFTLGVGAEITVKFTVTNTANNPTLNVNSTGAKPIYYRGSAITAGYLAANRTYTFRFNGTQYEFVGDLDSNSFDRIRYNGNIKCSATAIVAGNLIVGNNGTFQHLKLGKPFDITYPILYAGAAIAANGTGSNNYKAIAVPVTTTQSITLTQYKPVYIKGKLVGTTFTPVSTAPLTQTVPTTADGYQYILLGLAYATNGLYLYPENPIYSYRNGSFGMITGADIVDVTSSVGMMTFTKSDGTVLERGITPNTLVMNGPFPVAADITPGTLIAYDTDNKGYRKLAQGNYYDLKYPILYDMYSAVSKGDTLAAAYKVAQIDVGLTNMTPGNPVYLQGTYINGIFQGRTTGQPFTQTEPTSQDNIQYLFIGLAESANRVNLALDHPVYEFRNGKFQLYSERDSNIVYGTSTISKSGTKATITIPCQYVSIATGDIFTVAVDLSGMRLGLVFALTLYTGSSATYTVIDEEWNGSGAFTVSDVSIGLSGSGGMQLVIKLTESAATVASLPSTITSAVVKHI